MCVWKGGLAPHARLLVRHGLCRLCVHRVRVRVHVHLLGEHGVFHHALTVMVAVRSEGLVVMAWIDRQGREAEK